jgi:hypothetical protein
LRGSESKALLRDVDNPFGIKKGLILGIYILRSLKAIHSSSYWLCILLENFELTRVRSGIFCSFGLLGLRVLTAA